MAKVLGSKQPKYLVIGEILRPHGVRGELRMRVLTDYPQRLPELEHIYLSETAQSKHAEKHIIEHIRMHKGYGLLKLEKIGDRNQAELLRGLFVLIGLEEAVPLEDDEIYLFQLIGMPVITEDGTSLGKITDVIETGANDVYVVQSPERGEILIPVIDETILETNSPQST